MFASSTNSINFIYKFDMNYIDLVVNVNDSKPQKPYEYLY